MKVTTISVAVAAICVLGSSAQARDHHPHHVAHREARAHHYARHDLSFAQDNDGMQQGYADFGRQVADTGRRSYQTAVGGRPSAWCGWQMRQLVGNDPGPSYNLARNWAHWGRPGPAGVGAVVVWSHHVGKIVGQKDGMWVIESGNDGHALRSRPRSIGGAIAIRWG